MRAWSIVLQRASWRDPVFLGARVEVGRARTARRTNISRLGANVALEPACPASAGGDGRVIADACLDAVAARLALLELTVVAHVIALPTRASITG